MNVANTFTHNRSIFVHKWKKDESSNVYINNTINKSYVVSDGARLVTIPFGKFCRFEEVEHFLCHVPVQSNLHHDAHTNTHTHIGKNQVSSQ